MSKMMHVNAPAPKSEEEVITKPLTIGHSMMKEDLICIAEEVKE
jgi:hypothetical protein